MLKSDASGTTSEFERVLREKKREKKITTLEERIEMINKAEEMENENIRQNNKSKLTKDSKLNIYSASLLNEREDAGELKKKKDSFVNQNLEREKIHSSKNKIAKNGKIQGYRNSRSLVTVEKDNKDLLFQTIEKMETSGMTIQEIAKKLGRGVREIEIIKRLNEKS